MFGGAIGSVESKGVHFFNEDNFIYQEISKIIKIRRDKIALRRGRQFLRQISGDGEIFGLPEMIAGEIRSIIAWSMILSNKEMVLAMNTDTANELTAWVTIDAHLHQPGEKLT